MLQAFADENGNWRFLPSQILAEDHKDLSDVMIWRWLFEIGLRNKSDKSFGNAKDLPSLTDLTLG